MDIKTKFNYKDECFYLDNNEIVKDRICGYTMKVYKDAEMVIKCIVGKASDINEKLVFKTKQELLNSL